jgi:hypothetical protein
MPSGSTKTRCENRVVDCTIISAATQPPKSILETEIEVEIARSSTELTPSIRGECP